MDVSTKTLEIRSGSGQKENNDILKQALFYNSKGYNIRPILKPGQRGQKANSEQRYEEIIGDGKKAEGTGSWIISQRQKQSIKDIIELFSKYEQCNIALIQGKISGCRFVIDIDGQNADEIFQESIGLLSQTLAHRIYRSLFIKTGGGGLHLYLRYNSEDFPDGLHLGDDKKVLHKNGKRNEIAVKSDGSYVIAPPSISSSGKQYEVIKGDWDSIELLSKDEIDQFFSAIKKVSENYKKILVGRNNDTGKFEQLPIEEQCTEQVATQEDIQWIIETFKPFMIDTHKHNTKFSLAGILRKDYFLREEQTIEILQALHDDSSKNNLTVRDVYRREGTIVGYTMLHAELSGMTDAFSAREVINELKTRAPRIRNIDRPRTCQSINEDQNDHEHGVVHNILEDSKASESEKMAFLVEELMKKYTFKTLKDTEEIRYYKDGKYHKDGIQEIKKELENIAGYYITIHKRNEVINHIKAKTMVAREEFDKNEDIINVKNCFINIRTGEVIQHNSSYLSLIQIPVKYNQKAIPRKIPDFMYNVLQPSDVPLIIEYIAYCLIRNSKLQKDLMCVGEEDNGKSVMLKLISAFLGLENISSRTLHSLVTDKFAKADLYGKLANIFADISSKRLAHIETFKVLASGDRISAENKFQNSFEFEPFAKIIVSANRPPKPPDDNEDSYYKRWMILEFILRKNCFFCGKKIVKDRDLIDRLTTEEELSGLLNMVLLAAKRLLVKRRFVKTQSVKEIKNRYQTLADPVAAWLEDRCIRGEYHGDKKLLHSDFISYCSEKKLKRLELNVLGRELTKYGIWDRQIGSEKEHVWSGIMLKGAGKENDGKKDNDN